MISAVRDCRIAKAGREDVIDPGVADKRLLAYQPEFSQVLKVAAREGNTLGDVLRMAWDQGDLAVLSKGSPDRATSAHVSIVGHITKHELLELMSQTDAVNGFGNRFLWLCVKRSKFLPDGGQIDTEVLNTFTTRLRTAIECARGLARLTWSPAARAMWAEHYRTLSSNRPGLLGAILSRAEAQTLRLAVIYAALRGVSEIAVSDLKAALAVWQYCEDSARHIFGNRLGSKLLDTIIASLRTAQGFRLTRTQINKALSGHYNETGITQGLERLKDLGIATPSERKTNGRPVEVWTLAG